MTADDGTSDVLKRAAKMFADVLALYRYVYHKTAIEPTTFRFLRRFLFSTTFRIRETLESLFTRLETNERRKIKQH